MSGKIEERMVKCLWGVMPLRPSRKPIYYKALSIVPVLVLSSHLSRLCAGAVIALLQLSLLCSLVDTLLSSRSQDAYMNYIDLNENNGREAMKMVSRAPWALDEARWLRSIITKPCQILLYCPGCLVAAVLAFKGQTAWDNKVFMSCSYVL